MNEEMKEEDRRLERKKTFKAFFADGKESSVEGRKNLFQLSHETQTDLSALLTILATLNTR